MARPNRCWICGAVLRDGRGVCSECVSAVSGLCSRCIGRGLCETTYRIAAEERERAGLEPPAYPPCTYPAPGAPARSHGLERTQRATYGLPAVGLVPLILAAEDAVIEEAHAREGFSSEVIALAERWGARVRRGRAA